MGKAERLAWILLVLLLTLWAIIRDPSSGISGPRSVAAGRQEEPPPPGSRPAIGERPQRERRAAPTPGSTPATLAMRSLQNRDPLQRKAGFLQLLVSTNAASFGEVKAAFEKLKARGISLPEEEALMQYRAGQLQGAELLRQRRGTAADFAAIGEIRQQYEGWLQTDPAAARDWADALPAGKFRDQMAVASIAASTQVDPGRAWEQLASLRPALQSTAGRQIASRLGENGSLDTAAEMLTAFENGSTDPASPCLAALFDSLVTRASQTDAPIAAELIETHLEKPYVDEATLARFSTGTAGRNPVAALEQALDLENRKPGLAAGSLLAAAVEGMDAEGLSRAAAWSRARPGDPAAGAARQLIEKRQSLLENRGDDSNEYDRDD